MKLIEPKVELLSEIGISPESHIARCARVCYGKEYKEPNQEADEKMVNGLIKRGHMSMLRHASVYLYHTEDLPTYLKWRIVHSPYWNNDAKEGVFNSNYGFASTNLQEFNNFEKLVKSEADGDTVSVINEKDFLDECHIYDVLFRLYRLTFCITTQIATSRELNRVSPNNIAERSTRYCTQKDGLEIVRPWWWNDDDSRRIDKIRYENAINKAEFYYRAMIDDGMKPEDARGILPLDTATKVVYTYSVQEWQHILDLRLYDKTGKAHPNAHVVMQMVKDQINEFAKAHGIDYQV
jgi:thymidylate synthase (FAD)